ncbi:MAG: esterase [Dehalococcoidia bacterium]
MTTATATRTRDRVVPFTAGDGLQSTLINVRGEAEPTRGPVILVHGAGVRAEIFRAPVRQTIVEALVEAGYDVWLENWRASIDVAPNLWDLDQAARYDHPAAVQRVVQETGADTVQAIIHCQGSTSFTMSVMAGLVPEVKTVVSNAVSLHPVIPDIARLKMRAMLPITRPILDYMNPQWGNHAPSLLAKALNAFVNLTHRECDNAVCKWSSFTYGVGFPTLWRHENLNDETHEWLRHEFAEVPRTFFAQMLRCLDRGHLVSTGEVEGLPRDFAADPQTEARFALFAGEQNRCFLPASQTRTHHYMERRGMRSSLHVIPGYGHLDIFMGQRAAQDVFPLILRELD